MFLSAAHMYMHAVNLVFPLDLGDWADLTSALGKFSEFCFSWNIGGKKRVYNVLTMRYLAIHLLTYSNTFLKREGTKFWGFCPLHPSPICHVLLFLISQLEIQRISDMLKLCLNANKGLSIEIGCLVLAFGFFKLGK